LISEIFIFAEYLYSDTIRTIANSDNRAQMEIVFYMEELFGGTVPPNNMQFGGTLKNKIKSI
jgi:hypothetical protein